MAGDTRQARAWGTRQRAASGVEVSRLRRRDRADLGAFTTGEIASGELGRAEPPRRLSGRRCGWSRRLKCQARRRRRRRRCMHACGQGCIALCETGCEAKCGSAPQERVHEPWHRRAAKPTRVMPATGVAGQGKRSEAEPRAEPDAKRDAAALRRSARMSRGIGAWRSRHERCPQPA